MIRNNVHIPRRESYERSFAFSATIHPALKRTIVAMSERTGLSISQVTDEVLYADLVEMQEIPELEEKWGWGGSLGRTRGERTGYSHMIRKVVRGIYLARCNLKWHHESLIIRQRPSKTPPFILKQTD